MADQRIYMKGPLEPGEAPNLPPAAPGSAIDGYTTVTTALDATGTGTRYDIGGGNNDYSDPAGLDWQSLQPGDVVNIYYRVTPYSDKLLLSEQGTAANPIVINGVTNIAGQRPIFDADGSTSVNPSEWDSDWRYTMILINRQKVSGTAGVLAEHYTIQNLHLRDCTFAGTFTHSGGSESWQPVDGAPSMIMSRGGKHITLQGNIIENTEGNGLFVGGDDVYSSESWTISGNKFTNNGEGNRHHQVYFQAMNEAGVDKNLIQGNVFDDPRSDVTSAAQLKVRGTGTVIRYNWFTSAQRTIDLVEAQDDIPNNMFDNWTTQQITDEYRTSYIYGNAFVIDLDDSAILGQLLHVGMDTLENGDNGQFQNTGSANGQDAQRGINGGATYFYNNTVFINNYYPGGSYRSELFDLDSNEEATGSYSAGKLVSINNVFEFDGGATTRYAHGERTGDINWDGANIVNYSEIHNNVLYESDAYANAENTGDDPNIDITVNGNILSGTASLTDPTNATLLSKDLTLANGSAAIGQATALPSVLDDYPVSLQPADPNVGGADTRSGVEDLGAYENGTSTVHDNFNGATQALDSAKWDTYEDGDTSSDLTVQQEDGKYNGAVGAGDADTTLWFDTAQGRHDYVTLSGDFDVIARNVGLADSPTPDENDFQFCGLMVWLSSHNYEFAVVGNRGGTGNTIECKITNDAGGGDSTQTDLGQDYATNYRMDVRVTRVGSTVRWYTQAPGTSPDSWTEITSTFDGLSNDRISFGTGAVRVGLVTYGYLFVAAFDGTCDQVEIPTGTPT